MNRDEAVPLPGCALRYVERVVGDMVLSKRVRAEVRSELLEHFEDALRWIDGDEARSREAEALIAEFGDEQLLGSLIRRGKLRAEGGRGMNLSGVLGLALIVGGVLLVLIMGGRASVFFNIPSVIIVAWLTAGMGVLSFGLVPFLRAVWDMRSLVLSTSGQSLDTRSPKVLRGLVVHTYASGLIGCIIGIIQMLATFDDPSKVGIGMAIALLTVFYAALGAEGILRPGLRRVESLLAEDVDTSEPMAVAQPDSAG